MFGRSLTGSTGRRGRGLRRRCRRIQAGMMIIRVGPPAVTDGPGVTGGASRGR